MPKIIFLAIAMGLVHVANAKIKTSSETAKPVFILVASGQQTEAIQATQAAMRGERVLKCSEVEAVASDKGSISLKPKK